MNFFVAVFRFLFGWKLIWFASSIFVLTAVAEFSVLLYTDTIEPVCHWWPVSHLPTCKRVGQQNTPPIQGPAALLRSAEETLPHANLTIFRMATDAALFTSQSSNMPNSTEVSSGIVATLAYSSTMGRAAQGLTSAMNDLNERYFTAKRYLARIRKTCHGRYNRLKRAIWTYADQDLCDSRLARDPDEPVRFLLRSVIDTIHANFQPQLTNKSLAHTGIAVSLRGVLLSGADQYRLAGERQRSLDSGSPAWIRLGWTAQEELDVQAQLDSIVHLENWRREGNGFVTVEADRLAAISAELDGLLDFAAFALENGLFLEEVEKAFDARLRRLSRLVYSD